MVRITAVLSTLFIINCLVLAYISKQESKSLMEKVKIDTTADKAKAVGAAAIPQEKKNIPAAPEEVLVTKNEVSDVAANLTKEEPK